jgi:hypothetical protein
VPTIGYIPIPDYLLARPPNCCIQKRNPDLLHTIEVFAQVIHWDGDLVGYAVESSDSLPCYCDLATKPITLGRDADQGKCWRQLMLRSWQCSSRAVLNVTFCELLRSRRLGVPVDT